ncbi:hypothetical protein ACLB2K_050152 [Fragaria x ananassa]
MSDEEHQFESKADAGASKTYPQQAGTIRKNGYLIFMEPSARRGCDTMLNGSPSRPALVIHRGRALSRMVVECRSNTERSGAIASDDLRDGIRRKRLAVYVSGGGSNFRSIHEACVRGLIHGDIVVLVTNKQGCGGADYARDKGLPVVVEVSTSKTGKHGHAKCHFVAIDIFNGKKLEDIVPSSHNCDVPHVNRTDYQLIDISEDGFVSLLSENGNTKDDLRLPTDDALLTQLKDGFAEGKDLVVTVMSAMGEEQIYALKDIGPK